MDKQTENKVRIINKTFESIKRDNKSLGSVSLEEVAKELSMPLEELTSFFLGIINNDAIAPNKMKYKKYFKVCSQPTGPRVYLVNKGAKK